ncbi:MAG: homoserine O-succinyltransferase [bacterium]|nr:homoserine O-succinyltransferase [bacterium]
MKIALLNMMPDAALKATDRQYSRLLKDPQYETLIRFTFDGIARNEKTAEYIEKNYVSFQEIKSLNPTALIITGANVSDPCLGNQVFWNPLQEVMSWSETHVQSTLCSCLSSHAVMQFRYNQKRGHLPEKIWGVFDHQVVGRNQWLTNNLPERIPVPQSRFNEVSASQFQAANIQVLVESATAGVHLAASSDLSLVLMQGHPEYDAVSLLKEYKREVKLFVLGVREDFPPLPRNILSEEGKAVAHEYRDTVLGGKNTQDLVPEFPETILTSQLSHSWALAAQQVFSNWLKFLESLE